MSKFRNNHKMEDINGHRFSQIKHVINMNMLGKLCSVNKAKEYLPLKHLAIRSIYNIRKFFINHTIFLVDLGYGVILLLLNFFWCFFIFSVVIYYKGNATIGLFICLTNGCWICTRMYIGEFHKPRVVKFIYS